MTPTRLLDIDRAKGLAILLVVAGHIVARTPPANNDWYVVAKDAIYQFHMPFFMFLSGVVMGHTLRLPHSLTQYGTYVGKRFLRLFPAYVLFGLAILTGKLLGEGLVQIDNRPADFASGAVTILTRPAASAASSLWYIYVLFAYCLLMPVLLTATHNRLWPLVLGAVAVHFYPATDLLMLDGILEYSIYFCLGFLAIRNYARYVATLDIHRRPLVVGFALALAGFVLAIVAWPEARTASLMGITFMASSKLLLGCSAIPALHALVRGVLARSQLLFALGKYTFPIYLMNTIAIGVVKGALLRFWPWEGVNFLFFAPILLLSGIMLPILGRRLILSRVLVLDRITA